MKLSTAYVGRCGWDIDVVWSGLGGQCEHSPAWGSWIAGSLVRLILTAAVLVSGSFTGWACTATEPPLADRIPCCLLQVHGHTTPFAPKTRVRDLSPLRCLVPVSVDRDHGIIAQLPANGDGVELHPARLVRCRQSGVPSSRAVRERQRRRDAHFAKLAVANYGGRRVSIGIEGRSPRCICAGPPLSRVTPGAHCALPIAVLI